MTPSQLDAAYERKAELALEAGLHYKRTLGRNVADWEEAPRSLMARWVGLEASQIDKPAKRAFEAMMMMKKIDIATIEAARRS